MTTSRRPENENVPFFARRAAPLGAVALATAASIGLYGYSFGIHNHSIQIPFLRSLQDPTLFPGDRCMEAMRGYFSFFWPVMAELTRRLPLGPTFLVGHVLTTAATFAAVLAIGRRVFPQDPPAAYMGLWLVLWGQSVVGEESLHWMYLSHTPVATALGLWAVYAAVAGRWVLALALAGVVFDLHAVQSAYLLLMLLLAMQAPRRPMLRAAPLGLAAYLLAASPGLWWMLGSSVVGSPPDLAELLRAYFPFHFFPSSFRAHEWLGLGAMLVLWATCWFAVERTTTVSRLHAMCAAVVLMFVVGGASAEWLPLGPILKLHVFRAGSYLCYLVLILFGGCLASWWRAMGSRAVLAAAMLLAMAVAGSSRWLAVACLLPLAWMARRGRGPALVGGAAGFALFVLFWRWDLLGGLEEMPVLLSDAVFWPLLLGLIGLGLSVWLEATPRRAAAAVALGALGWLVWVSQANRVAEVRRFLAMQEPWLDVQRWAKAHTSPRDRFLTPPDREGFRVFSERSVVGEFKDGSAVLWDARYADYWRDWYRRVGGRFDADDRRPVWERLAQAWFETDQSRIEALARAYRAAYIVLRRPDVIENVAGVWLRWQGTPLYENDRYLVYTSRPAGGSDQTEPVKDRLRISKSARSTSPSPSRSLAAHSAESVVSRPAGASPPSDRQESRRRKSDSSTSPSPSKSAARLTR